MKGKISFYFNAPNVSKVRSRVVNPSKELSSQIRNAYQEAVTEIINEQLFAVRAKMIKKFAELGVVTKDDKATIALTNPLGSIWDINVSLESFGQAESEETEAEPEAEAGESTPVNEEKEAESTSADPSDFED